MSSSTIYETIHKAHFLLLLRLSLPAGYERELVPLCSQPQTTTNIPPPPTK